MAAAEDDVLVNPFTAALVDVLTERALQTHEFRDSHDAEHTPAEWIARVTKHVGRAVSRDPQTFRKEMVVVGALALAAIEAFDRNYPTQEAPA